MDTNVVKKQLGCGTTVVAESLPHSLTASVGFCINYGSRDEEERMFGAAHFIEHMLFKGTAEKNALDLALDIEAVGGAVGAGTSKELTRCYAHVLPEHIPQAVSILTDVFCRSVFPEEEFDREKGVILEEIKLYQDTPEEYVRVLFLEDLYGRGGLGHEILGYEDAIREVDCVELSELYRNRYIPSNIVVTAAGNFDGYDISRLIEESLGPLNGARRHPIEHAASAPNFTHGINLHAKDTGQVHFDMGFPGISKMSPDRYAYVLLSMVLGGGISSRLFQEVREKRGLVYEIDADNTTFSDSGFFAVSAGTRPENLPEVLSLVAAELRKCREGDIRQEELDRVKNICRIGMAMDFESVTSRMSFIADSEIFFGRHRTFTEIFDQIMAVSLDDLARISGDIFKDEKVVFTALGPFKKRSLKSTENKIADILRTI